jgi:hypothetical protein
VLRVVIGRLGTGSANIIHHSGNAMMSGSIIREMALQIQESTAQAFLPPMLRLVIPAGLLVC